MIIKDVPESDMEAIYSEFATKIDRIVQAVSTICRRYTALSRETYLYISGKRKQFYLKIVWRCNDYYCLAGVQ